MKEFYIVPYKGKIYFLGHKSEEMYKEIEDIKKLTNILYIAIPMKIFIDGFRVLSKPKSSLKKAEKIAEFEWDLLFNSLMSIEPIKRTQIENHIEHQLTLQRASFMPSEHEFWKTIYAEMRGLKSKL